MTLNQFINEFDYTQSWLFLQSRYYALSFSDMQYLVSSGLNDGNNADLNPLDGETFEPQNIFFEINLNSDRVKHCWMIKIQITTEQYQKLLVLSPNKERK